MPILTLNRDQVAKIATFCTKHKCDWFVAKDQGAYVGASAGNEQAVTVYFRGMNPSRDPDWYDKTRNGFGGDDFGHTFERAILDKALAMPGFYKMTVEVLATIIRVTPLCKHVPARSLASPSLTDMLKNINVKG